MFIRNQEVEKYVPPQVGLTFEKSSFQYVITEEQGSRFTAFRAYISVENSAVIRVGKTSKWSFSVDAWNSALDRGEIIVSDTNLHDISYSG